MRLDEAQSLSSDADDQLVLRIPFSGACKLKSLLLKTGPGGETPTSIALFVNADPPLDFGDDLDARAEMKVGSKGAPSQVLEQVAETRDVVEYPLRVARFSSVRDLTLFVRGSVGGDKIAPPRLPSLPCSDVGLRGESTNYTREAPSNLIYEATPQLKDHKKVPGTESGANQLGQ
ncbi:DUF1000-domain-containing protein [Jaminaea rosea]|uniref:DUF1000-domain-containing protein n=1 Tax=Jaminaea rosea TaxID=1569628 RepID=A0A316UK35_9BASI|nr:DUF1000-domain-containing protein [Jaminaea rosea]PWN25636.1 DUF1000-domain-containing protein [Jaminaea rosea]